MPVGTNQFECRDQKSYYVCSTGFKGCCTHDPCAAGYCEDDKKGTSEAETSTSSTTTVKPESRSGAPTITTFTATATATATAITSDTAITPTATSGTVPVSKDPPGSDSSTTATTPTATSGTDPVSKDPSDSGSSIDIALIGSIAGGILSLIILACFLFFFCRRRRKTRKSTVGYDSFQEKTAELDSPDDSYQFAGYRGAAANYNTPSTLNNPKRQGKQPTTTQDPVLLAGTPILPNELPASSPSDALELPSSVYKPPLPELSQTPTRELINQQNTLQNSRTQFRRATPDTCPSVLTTTPEGTVLRPNLNTSVRGKGPQKGQDPRSNHVMSFMSYDNRSDPRIRGQLNRSSTSMNQLPVPRPVASANLGSTN